MLAGSLDIGDMVTRVVSRACALHLFRRGAGSPSVGVNRTTALARRSWAQNVQGHATSVTTEL